MLGPAPWTFHQAKIAFESLFLIKCAEQYLPSDTALRRSPIYLCKIKGIIQASNINPKRPKIAVFGHRGSLYQKRQYYHEVDMTNGCRKKQQHVMDIVSPSTKHVAAILSYHLVKHPLLSEENYFQLTKMDIPTLNQLDPNSPHNKACLLPNRHELVFGILYIAAYEQFCSNTMDRQNPNFVPSEGESFEHFTPIRFHPPKGTPETTRNWTEEIVNLLNQTIDGKMDWEHEKLLLSRHNEQHQGLSEMQNQPNSQAMVQGKKEWKSELERIEELSDQEKEVKIPSIPQKEQEELSENDMEEEAPQQKPTKSPRKRRVKGCTCKKSGCLKMYCQCFRSGKSCQDCGCVGCLNKEPQHRERLKAVQEVIQRQPTAFNSHFKYKGCRCTKSQCLKGYCECFLAGHTCGKYCRCISCKNRTSSKPRRGSDITTIPDKV